MKVDIVIIIIYAKIENTAAVTMNVWSVDY